jgi:hypothetical protein
LAVHHTIFCDLEQGIVQGFAQRSRRACAVHRALARGFFDRTALVEVAFSRAQRGLASV